MYICIHKYFTNKDIQKYTRSRVVNVSIYNKSKHLDHKTIYSTFSNFFILVIDILKAAVA